MSFNLEIPTPSGPIAVCIDRGTSISIVGANGSGKTRLAVYIENMLGDQAHRISAHRALMLNPNVPKIKEGMALNGLRFGNTAESIHIGHRQGSRWQSKEAINLLNDFDYVIQALFAEQARTALVTHANARANVEYVAIATKFERLRTIWENLLPHRELVITGDDIRVRVPGDTHDYSAADMSDGERAIFYLIGQVVVAVEKSLLVIDEPELHVHRSIMNKLWDQLENARPDCSFVFVTHDLEFAASRVGQKFVVRDYVSATEQWAIELLPEDTGFPEELATLLLGSRRPILFVEGEMNSLDKAIYRCVYPHWTIVPRGSCKDVVHAVTTMRKNSAFTRLQCFGIVDADDYDATDIGRLRELGVAVLPVSEIENVLMLPEISREIALTEHLVPEDVELRIEALRSELLKLASQPDVIEPVVRRHCLRRIDRTLKGVDLSQKSTIDEIDGEYRRQMQSLSVREIAQERQDRINKAIGDRDLPALLSLIDNKGMLAKAASILKNTGLRPFEAWITRVLLNDRAPGLVGALRGALPTIAVDPEF